MKKVTPSRKEGFSLTELIAAMAIFAVGVMACLELYSVSLRSTTTSRDFTQAVLLAQGLMEETLVEEYLDVSSDNGDFGDNFPRHTWEREIEETEQLGLMDVQVVVSWTDQQGERSYRLSALHADRDVVEAVP